MALLPASIFDVSANNDQAKFTNMTASVEVRAHENKQADQEQIRTVVTIQMEQTVSNVGDVFISTSNVTASTLEGTMRGFDDFVVSFDAEYWEGSSFRLVTDKVIGIGEDGSRQAVLVQTWVAVSAWADAPWNA